MNPDKSFGSNKSRALLLSLALGACSDTEARSETTGQQLQMLPDSNGSNCDVLMIDVEELRCLILRNRAASCNTLIETPEGGATMRFRGGNGEGLLQLDYFDPLPKEPPFLRIEALGEGEPVFETNFDGTEPTDSPVIGAAIRHIKKNCAKNL